MHDLHLRNLQEESASVSGLTVNDLWSAPMGRLARQKIKDVLNPRHGEQFLTIAQIAKLFYSVKRDGQPAKSARVKPRANSPDTYELVEGYYSAQAILSDMLS